MKTVNRLTITGDDYGLREESTQPACSDCVADTAGRSSTVIVARNRASKWTGKRGEWLT